MLFSFGVIFTNNIDIRAQRADEEIAGLINSGDMFALNQRYSEVKDSIQIEYLGLMAEGFLATAFNRPEQACDIFGKLANEYQQYLGLEGGAVCVEKIAENLCRLGRYEGASITIDNFLEQIKDIEGFDNLGLDPLYKYIPLKVFGNRPIEIVRPSGDIELPFTKGEGYLKNLMYVNAELNGNEVPFVLDTGCDGFSTNFVSEDFASKNGIRLLDDSVLISGIGSGYVKMGLADSMRLGDITYRNVRFMVAPGNNLLPVDSIYIDAILGSAFMKAMGELQIYAKENKIVFPAEQSSTPGNPNMLFLRGQPYIEVHSGDERLVLHFDTGSGVSLSSRYYQKHKDYIEKTGRLRTEGGMGGFGGMKKIHQYILPDFPLNIAGADVNLSDVTVFSESTFMIDGADGSAGNDLLWKFDRVTINFDKMFVKVE